MSQKDILKNTLMLIITPKRLLHRNLLGWSIRGSRLTRKPYKGVSSLSVRHKSSRTCHPKNYYSTRDDSAEFRNNNWITNCRCRKWQKKAIFKKNTKKKANWITTRYTNENNRYKKFRLLPQSRNFRYR